MKQSVFVPASVLLPREGIPMEQWSIIAVDQYTSSEAYWNAVKEAVGDSPSAYRLVLPEIELDSVDTDLRTAEVNACMEEYLTSVFTETAPTYFYIERYMKNGTVRHGILGAFDLEEYDYQKGSRPQIRATEGTVLSRIPPRVRIRENAPLELPHIMVLADDPDNTVFSAAEEDAKSYGQIRYAFDLMQGGGHISGWQLSPAGVDTVDRLLAELGDRTPVDGMGCRMLYAVGDGNHSLAAAKAHYENLKKSLGEEVAKNHPARYCLAELVNLHDSALVFEPIYRVVFGVTDEELLSAMKEYYPALYKDAEGGSLSHSTELHGFAVICGERMRKICVPNPPHTLPVGTLQIFLDKWISEHPDCRIDYIHDTKEALRLAADGTAVAFLFEGMQKTDLFPSVVRDGVLPRKTFSMGHADEKRFYLEARKIR